MKKHCPIICALHQLSMHHANIVGGKGASLGAMTHAHIPVPPGFVITVKAFDLFLQHNRLSQKIDDLVAAATHKNATIIAQTAKKIRALILTAVIPTSLAQEIQRAFEKLNTPYVAVRSSATAEDSSKRAWAGQLETYLNTTADTLLNNIKKCWASLFTARALHYRYEQNWLRQKIAVAVVIQQMVESAAAGVAFSIHPTTQNSRQLIIEAGYGLGEAVVSGQITPDSYVVNKKSLKIAQKTSGTQTRALYRAQHGGNQWRNLSRKVRGKMVLSSPQILKLAKIILRIEQHYGFPCDVEWAYAGQKFYIVQSRPITTLNPQPRTLATPRRPSSAYMVAQYQQYAKDLIYFDYPGVIFYTCLTWFWLTDQAQKYFGTTVPFFTLFMRHQAAVLTAPFYLGPGEVVMRQLIKHPLAWIRKNQKVIDRAEKIWLAWLAQHSVPAGKSLHYYVALLQKTVKVFLKQHIHFQIATQIDYWLNKKLVQIFDHTQSKLTEQEIFNLCVSHKKTANAYHSEALKQLQHWCATHKIPRQSQNFATNLANCVFKNKLQHCYDLGYFLRAGYGGVTLWTLLDEYHLLRTKETAPAPLPGFLPQLTPTQKTWIRIAQHFSAVRDRRKSLQQRTFYHLAQILEEIGKTLKISRSDLENLRVEEFKPSFLTSSKVRTLIKQRKLGYLGFWAPAVKTWEWSGKRAVKIYHQLPQEQKPDQELIGQSASHGRVRGRVQIVLNPRVQTKFPTGAILVTGMTSPDFVPLMKKAAAIITELGGITCHAAIIARELKKPCVIGVHTATKILKNGDWVEVDATRGVVTTYR